MAKKYVIYVIRDPRDDVPIYIGQTSNYSKRKQAHTKKTLSKKPNIKTISLPVYLIFLGSVGLKPKFEELEMVETEEESLESETAWIKYFVIMGYPMLNRWKEHRKIVKSKFSSKYLKSYFGSRLEL